MTKWRKLKPDEVFSTAEIAARLREELPAWCFEDGWIHRTFKTSGWQSTMLVVGVIGHLAEAAWHHPDLTVSFAMVTVKLMSHDAKGITEKDFQLAAKIVEVVMWPPDKPEVATPKASPENSRGRYIHYDE